MIEAQVLFLNDEEAKLILGLDSRHFNCDLDVLLQFDFVPYPHVLTFANRFVIAAIWLVVDEFTQNYGSNGLLQDEFRVEDLTVRVVNIEVSDYYERNGDKDDDEVDSKGKIITMPHPSLMSAYFAEKIMVRLT